MHTQTNAQKKHLRILAPLVSTAPETGQSSMYMQAHTTLGAPLPEVLTGADHIRE